MQPRYERKYYLSAQTAELLKRRAASVLTPDPHSEGGRYWVHNLYFDDIYYSAYNEKQSSAFSRDKYRLRFYNGNLDYIRLEHKHKEGELTFKRSANVTEEQYQRLAHGDLRCVDFFGKRGVNGLRPVIAFKYLREAYYHDTAGARLTFDSQIAGGRCAGVLELKYNRFIPSFVSEMFSGFRLTMTETSKYCIALEARLKYHDGITGTVL